MTQLKADINIFENQFALHPIVMIGDFNVADNLHDTSLTLKTRTIDTLEQIKEDRDLHDLATKTGNEHTFHTGGQRTYCSSRIDKVLTNLSDMQSLFGYHLLQLRLPLELRIPPRFRENR